MGTYLAVAGLLGRIVRALLRVLGLAAVLLLGRVAALAAAVASRVAVVILVGHVAVRLGCGCVGVSTE